MTSEAARTDAIIKRLRAAGAFAVKLHGNMFSRGLPDIAAVIRGYSVWLEVKVPGNKATVLQEKVMQDIRDAGGWAGVVHGVDDIEDLLEWGPELCCSICLKAHRSAEEMCDA